MTVKNYETYWSELKTSHDAHPGNLYRYGLIQQTALEAGLTPASIVDCGCGDGSLLGVLHDTFPQAKLFGLDVSETALARVAAAGAVVRQCDFGVDVPADFPPCELVVCSEVIEHIQDDNRVLENLKKLCAPGGHVILTTQTGRIYNTEVFLGHIRHYQLDDLRQRCEARGLKVVRAFRAGWPWLRLQKVAAHHMQSAVRKHVVDAQELSLPVRAAFKVLTQVYKTSSRSTGPQLVVLARRTD